MTEPVAPPELIRGRNIVCFSTADWDTLLPTNKHQIMRRLAEHNRVLFIETLGTRAPSLASGTDLGRIGRRISRSMAGIQQRSKTLWTLSPLVRPNWSSSLSRLANQSLFSLQIREALAKFPNPILWVYSPYAVYLLDQFPRPAAVVYHLVDDLSAVPGADASSIREAENALLARADVVYCTERSLYDRARTINPQSHWMPNVADFGHFSNPEAGRSGSGFRAITARRRPRVLLSGNLTPHKVDLKLVGLLATRMKDVEFLLVGPKWEGADARSLFRGLEALPNVTFTGHVPYEELPAVLHAADVLLIPYVRNAATRAVFPLKFFEYLATGKPVVASPLVSLLPYRDAVYLAEKPARWEEMIRRALANPEHMAEQRQVLARRQTWEHRLAEMTKVLVPLLRR
ncbi:MAG: glycosyltransferase [Candidatus Sumerlaeia bacterium]|nr:glycosyltransferase [Candidatus Sumerlaeia bacterium]